MQVHNWQTITEEHGPAVWRTAYRLLGNEADTADCFQETFLAAFELSQRQRIRNMSGLLKRLATMRAIDRLRWCRRNLEHLGKHETRQAVVGANPGPARQAQASELASRLRTAISQLPQAEAKAFCLRHFSDMSYRDIAQALDIKTSAAGVLLHRARAKLREYLRETETEQERPSDET